MKPTITCKSCGAKISLDEALLSEIKEENLKEVTRDYETRLRQQKEAIKREAEIETQKKIQEAETKTSKRIEEKLGRQLQNVKEEADDEKKENQALREELKELMRVSREEKRTHENAELKMQKKFDEQEKKIREDAEKNAAEKERLKIADRDKTIKDLQEALETAQRKASQGSQQRQGEILELDLEKILTLEFKDDDILPIEKGVRGADIKQAVKTPRGMVCGVILWETKRTKNWTEGWIQKLKDDCRTAKADIPVLITEIMPKETREEIIFHDGVWVAKPAFTLILAMLLRKNLLDVGRQRALAENRGTKADALYTFVTSHEFAQQVESMIETYKEMHAQVTKERAAYEKFWSQREKQAQKLLLSTTNIIGAMQEHVGQASMPKIKGLELLESPEPTE